MKKQLTLSYGSIQGTYWMYYGAILSFASVFLLSKDYSNSEIGMILATASTLSVILQPLIADLADRSKSAVPTVLISIITAGLLLITAALFLFPTKSMILSILFILLGAWHAALQPLINSMAFSISPSQDPINFGLTRSGGSIAYAALCYLLGILVTAFGIQTIPATGTLVLFLLLLCLGVTHQLYLRSANFRSTESAASHDAVTPKTIDLKAFLGRNKAFIVFNAGIVLIFFQNSVLNNYLMQILMEVGGTSSDMGSLFSFMALLELPGLVFFKQLRQRFTCQFLLKVSSIAFTVKILLILTATSVSLIYVAFLFQLISFPIFLSASVHLVDETMEQGEAVKGHSFVTGAMTLSAVFASLLGGAILDHGGSFPLLVLSTTLAAAGTVIVFLAVDSINACNSSR